MTVTTAQELAQHAGHNVEVAVYVDPETSTVVECHDCGMILIEFTHRSGRDACYRCDEGTMQVVHWLPESAADEGYYMLECDNCSLLRQTRVILPDDDEWARAHEEEE